MFNGTVGSGEAYMKGSWRSPDLTNVIRVMCKNMDLLHAVNRGWSTLNSVLAGLFHRFVPNSKKNARLNIAAHYDLGNDFFSLFLDPTMMYSSAIYSSEKTTLNEAAVYKLEHICQRLQLSHNDHLLEIGTGWGGMAIYAAKNYGCRVTTTTISEQQYQYTLNKVKKLNLQDKITVLFNDYRDLEGSFDKLVSIEMIEAVGRQYYKDYFSVCSRLLKSDGLMLIQAITMPDQRYNKYNNTADFIQRYIFPGGDLPCLSVLSHHVNHSTDMQIVGHNPPLTYGRHSTTRRTKQQGFYCRSDISIFHTKELLTFLLSFRLLIHLVPTRSANRQCRNSPPLKNRRRVRC